MRRVAGTGTISPHRGKFRARLTLEDGRRVPCGVHPTREAAEAALVQARAEVTLGQQPTTGLTLAAWGERALDLREREGVRGIDRERSRWRAHIATSRIAGVILKQLTRAQVVDWISLLSTKKAAKKGTKLARQTLANSLNLLRAILQLGVERGVIEVNPARDVGVPRRAGAESTLDPWTYLLPDEIGRLSMAPERPEDRRLVAFAIGTGLRQGEAYSLLRRDVHVDGERPHVVVRYGSPGRPTKNGSIRRVPLFGMALRAAREQLANTTSTLMWPALRGGYRALQKPPRGWKVWLKTAKLDRRETRHDGRNVRWHDLRHTCASALLSGWWGRRWSLEEVRGMLGHSTIAVTQRYAHLAQGALDSAARETTQGDIMVRWTEGHTKATALMPAPIGLSSTLAEILRSHLGDLNPRPAVYENDEEICGFEGLTVDEGHACPPSPRAALDGLGRGDGSAALAWLEARAADVKRGLLEAQNGRWAKVIVMLQRELGFDERRDERRRRGSR